MSINDSDYDDDFSDLEDDTQRNKYITFALDDEAYGIEIKFVTEIIGLQKITHLPDMPDFFKGVINLRGTVIPIIDMRKRFKLPPVTFTERTCIIVVNIEEYILGLIVDEVSEVLDIPGENVSPPPKTSRTVQNRYIKGIGKVGDAVKVILNVDSIFTEDELSGIMESV